MADCDDIWHDLFLFLDGELGPDERVSLTVHLTDCGDCVEMVEFHAELKTIVAATCQGDDLPAGLLERLRARLEDQLAGDEE